MSYRDPQQVIDNRIGILSQGVAQLLGDTTKRLDAYTAQKTKEKALYKKTMDKAAGRAASRASGNFDKAKAASDKFTSGLYGESGSQTEEGVLFDQQITGVFGNWGTELNNQITEIQNAGGSEMEIAAVTDKYIGKVNQFTTDMANWEAARSEYMAAKQAAMEGGENSVGSLILDPELQRNPEMVAMFDAMTDDELDNLYITIDPNGSTRISMGSITDGKFDAQSTTDISAWARNHADSPDGKYFITNEKFDATDYNNMENVLKDIEGNEELQVNGALDRDLVRDYLLTNEQGQTLMNPFLDGSSVNKWASLYDSKDSSRQYTDNDYLGLVFDNTWDNLYSPKQKKPIKTKSSSSSSSKKSNYDKNINALAQQSPNAAAQIREKDKKKQNRKKLITTKVEEEEKEETKVEEKGKGSPTTSVEEIKKLQKEVEKIKNSKIPKFTDKQKKIMKGLSKEQIEKQWEKDKAIKIKQLEENIKKLKKESK